MSFLVRLTPHIIGICTTLIFLWLLVISLDFYSMTVIRSQAIERGYAGYCEKTGNWAWKGECK